MRKTGSATLTRLASSQTEGQLLSHQEKPRFTSTDPHNKTAVVTRTIQITQLAGHAYCDRFTSVCKQDETSGNPSGATGRHKTRERPKAQAAGRGPILRNPGEQLARKHQTTELARKVSGPAFAGLNASGIDAAFVP